MVLFPLPFLTAFFLIFLLLNLALTGYRDLSKLWLTLFTIACYALQSILVGINWGVAPLPAMLLPSLAVLLAPLTWLSLNQLSGLTDRRHFLSTFVLVAVLLVGLNLAALLRVMFVTDAIGIGVYVWFGAMLIWQGYSSEADNMESRPLHLMIPAQRAYLIAGAILLASATIDIVVTLDIELNDRRLSSALVGYSNLALLLVMLFIFFRNRLHAPNGGQAQKPFQTVDPVYREIIDKLDRHMSESKLYRNEGLSLNRISSCIRVPSRQISSAINSLCAMNVPQYVNTFRIREACQLLEETDIPVTEIVFAVGFTTKSNFNREFQRVTGFTPSGWRSRARNGAA